MNKLSREEIMLQWDNIRKLIANGDRTSYPRDWFESILDYVEEKEQETRTKMREVLISTLTSLAAATSLLESGGKTSAASDTIFNMMIKDYKKSIEDARALLKEIDGLNDGE